jgi:hypothetical protein
MFDLTPLLLWSEEKLCSWAVSLCCGIHSNAVQRQKALVMVNGTTYAKKLRLNIRNGNRNIDIEKYI